ncbi:MAG: translation initiation factor IF-3 [Bacilli bacterium]|nr:translation initiation factor IF-3 [Bacilli bacterium]
MGRVPIRFFAKEEVRIANYHDRSRPERRFDPINEHIRYPEVLVIGPQGESLGRMSSYDANRLAASYGLDLFCVAPQANPPVCKILNYGKYRFEQQKQKRESKKNQHIVETKQVQLHISIGQHDMETKARHARGFLEDGNKVQVCVILKGREMAHKEIGEEVSQRFVSMLSDIAGAEKPAAWEGKWYNVILSTKAKKNQ